MAVTYDEAVTYLMKQREKAERALVTRKGKATDEELHRLEVKKEAYAIAVISIVGVAE